MRTNEIGVRVTLGARPAAIFRIIVGEGLRCALIGLTFGGVAVLLLLVALAASFLPARRATRMDPVAALRYE